MQDRVSISRLPVRPIMRGKKGKRVEFWAAGVVAVWRVSDPPQTISWDGYSEGGDLSRLDETYRRIGNVKQLTLNQIKAKLCGTYQF